MKLEDSRAEKKSTLSVPFLSSKPPCDYAKQNWRKSIGFLFSWLSKGVTRAGLMRVA
jgi:hypothetical protein